jgi:uncharacterized lipoprotein YehR (DUF1307 family)
MIWRRRYKLMTVVVAIVLAVMLMGCGTKPQPKLKALDSFWDTLGGKVKDLTNKVE